MRLEILVGDDEPRIYPLTKERITIGGSEDSDISIAATDVSRKHIVVIVEDENFFVVDQGSKNGSFINDEQLIPGKRVPFKSFFPVRLGSNTIISLISDEDFENSGLEEFQFKSSGEDPKRQDIEEKTRVINLDELKSVRTIEVIKTKKTIQRNPVGVPENAHKRDKSRMRIVTALSVIILGLAGLYQVIGREPKPKIEKPVVAVLDEVVPTGPQPTPIPLVPKEDLTPRNKFEEILSDMKCVSDAEVIMCNLFQKDLGNNLGVVQRGTMLNIFLAGTEEYKKALEIIYGANYADGTKVMNDEDIALVTFFLFFKHRIPEDFNYDAVKEMKLTFILLIQREEGAPVLMLASAINPDALLKLRPLLEDRYIKNIPDYGVSTLNFMRSYLVIY